MNKYILIIISFLFASCYSNDPHNYLSVKTELPNKMKEISGMVAVDDGLWVITDNPKPRMFKLDTAGKLLQQVNFVGIEVEDMESLAVDEHYLYVGDVGDNEGERQVRKILKIRLDTIGKGKSVDVTPEVIDFSFNEDVTVERKKKNEHDVEAMICFGDSIYLFTKRRSDHKTELFAMPKTTGHVTAYSKATFDSKGLITGAAFNSSKNELILVGYQDNHEYPFMLVFTDFNGSNFFQGKQSRIELADKPWDWQIESVAFYKDGTVYFACEETDQVAATLYGVKRHELKNLHKAKK